MNANRTPVVLIVDDELEQQAAFRAVLEAEDLKVIVRLPGNVDDADLRMADIVLVDQYYDWEVLEHPRELGYWPVDGLALVSVISSHMSRLQARGIIVLRTGALDRLAQSLPKMVRVAMLAHQRELEWVLEKGHDSVKQTVQILRELAHAATYPYAFLSDVPADWDEGSRWLALPLDASWTNSALAELQVCRPPVNAVARFTSGRAWIRWFAHQVLSFPTFLVNDLRAATVLRLPAADFTQVVNSRSSVLGDRIRRCQYRGELASLVGRRWWRSGLDALVDEILANDQSIAAESEALEAAYNAIHPSPLSVLQYQRPVVTIDSDYQDVAVEESDDCVRLAPDMWPLFADEPWALREEVMDDPQLRAMVARGDRHLLDESEV